MVDIDSEDDAVQDYELRPLLFIQPVAPIIHNHQIGAAVGDTSQILGADFR